MRTSVWNGDEIEIYLLSERRLNLGFFYVDTIVIQKRFSLSHLLLLLPCMPEPVKQPLNHYVGLGGLYVDWFDLDLDAEKWIPHLTTSLARLHLRDLTLR
jgi:hypothetical protein